MITLANIVVFLVAIEHIAICGIEMFASPERQARVFDMKTSFTKQESAQVALANQGIYNGMLGIIMIIAFFIFDGMTLPRVWFLLLSMIIVVAIYGGFTATKKIWLVQLLPAVIAVILLALAH
ncbi:DUF1304 domain-containing protein [Lactobacillus agrestimuris]|uniref:DUF1304 domain-containing protein n=1 Tax=Lactobacillus agrestimuris TaxID=2941328 RepID=UPI002043849D|nr:DUF1304 domain-containing protein [Lactobacillus agrestimuris]